jgi:general secretion pathway protein K
LRASEKGGALLTVLWLSAGLAAIAFSVGSMVRTETERTSTSAEGLRASYLASGALERAMMWMQWGWDGGYRTTQGVPFFWQNQAPQPRLYMSFPSGAAVVEVLPESSKLDINKATPDDLYRVVLAVSADPNRARTISDEIVNWRSPSAAGSALDQLYLSWRPTFRPPHAFFREIEELLLIRGMTPELFYGNYVADARGRLFPRGGLRDCLSVWGSVGPFDINTMSPILMEAMGVPPDQAAAFANRRTLVPFRSVAEIAQIAPVPTRISLVGGNSIWTLRAAARLSSSPGRYSDVVRSAAAVVQILDYRRFQRPMEFTVLRWYEDAWSQNIVPPDVGMPLPGGNILGTVRPQ